MRSLARAVSSHKRTGEPLPHVFPALARRGAVFRKGEVTMVAGPPGVGKSTVALWLAVAWSVEDDLLGMYFSADSSELVMATRATSMLTGIQMATVEDLLVQGDEYTLGELDRLSGKLRWSFEPDITYDDVELELKAFEEMYGRHPDYIVIDNLTDVEGQAEDEFAALRRVMKGLTYVARKSGAAIVVLHHTSEAGKLEPCPPRKDIHGKVSQKCALILTIADDPAAKYLAVVKNRFGPYDKSGRTADTIPFVANTMQFGGA